MNFYPGFDIEPVAEPMGFRYGTDVFGPEPEFRHLDAIRPSLRNPECTGPDIVYAIAMDVGKTKHQELLNRLHLLYGVVTYAGGQLGEEPIRSQGHIHAVSPLSGLSTPEVYEIWDGEAVIYMQEYAADDPGRCFAVYARPGDVVVVPPSWAHATISANPQTPLTFGAWCDRQYGFDYKGVRAHKGLAWFPLLKDGQLQWERNPLYLERELVCKAPRIYDDLDIRQGLSIYRIFEEQPEIFRYVPQPQLKINVWENFIP
ncbi:MAG: glucose-6-phosphate isomerase [Tannerella sp.]|jgi:glucose-6-phosphate isomerase|nr:glucose-6-phosphate isomerase [Tannerella sp.]